MGRHAPVPRDRKVVLAVAVLAMAAALVPLREQSASAAGSSPVSGFAVKPDRSGYWLVASDGDVSGHGSSADLGGMEAARLNSPIVGMAPTARGSGYWLVASDGGIFAFGDAVFHGSTGSMSLVQPITAMAATPTGKGYWLVASDGGIFAFGDARFHGSGGGRARTDPIVGMAATASGLGSWMVTSSGQVLAFGDAPMYGSAPALASPAVGIARLPDGAGYQVASADGTTVAFTAAGAEVAPGTVPSSRSAAIAREVFDLLNSERSGRGLAPLVWDPQLAALAQEWADHLAATDRFVHRNLQSTLGAPGFAGVFASLGENIAAGSITSGWVHQMWMSSAGHRQNLLQPGFDSAGIGIACDANGQLMAVQNLGRHRTTTAAPIDGATPPLQPFVNNTRTGTGC